MRKWYFKLTELGKAREGLGGSLALSLGVGKAREGLGCWLELSLGVDNELDEIDI